MKTVNFCLPGGCYTAFVREGDAPAAVAQALADRYEREHGVLLTSEEVDRLADKIRKETT